MRLRVAILIGQSMFQSGTRNHAQSAWRSFEIGKLARYPPQRAHWPLSSRSPPLRDASERGFLSRSTYRDSHR